MEVSKELLEEAEKFQSVEELMAAAKEEGIELSEEDAKAFLAAMKKEINGEIADEELDDVAGGSWRRGGSSYSSDPPHYLITTVANSCSLFKANPEKVGRAICKNCANTWLKGCVRYCKARTFDVDPINPRP